MKPITSVDLRPHQIEAVNNMKNGCILCGDTGSGKSLTAIAYYYILNGGKIGTKKYTRLKHPMDLYIITTARKRDTFEWEGELTAFLLSPYPDLSLYKHKIVIDSWNNIQKYKDIENAFFIFDEQRVVGSGPWVTAFLKIAKHNQWILLSATPGDTWTDYIPVFIANGFYKNRTEFLREHVVYKSFTRFPQIDRYLNIKRLVRLRDKILVNMNYDKSTVQHHEPVWVDYDVLTYKKVVRTRWNIWEDHPIKNASEFCQVLRHVVNAADSRQLAVLEIFEKHPRVIIFYNYDYELEILKNLYYGKKVKIAEWNGHKHQPIPESESWVYLVNYNAGAEGWNCIKTDTIIFYSQNYSYRTMKQSSGRIDRMNTPYTDLYYYHLKSRAGIDRAIDKALTEKKKFNETGFAVKFEKKGEKV